MNSTVIRPKALHEESDDVLIRRLQYVPMFAQNMLNKAMGLRSWNYKVQSLEDINKRISIAKSMLDAGEL